MGSSTLEGVLLSLRSMADEKLGALDALFARESAWLAGLGSVSTPAEGDDNRSPRTSATTTARKPQAVASPKEHGKENTGPRSQKPKARGKRSRGSDRAGLTEAAKRPQQQQRPIPEGAPASGDSPIQEAAASAAPEGAASHAYSPGLPSPLPLETVAEEQEEEEPPAGAAAGECLSHAPAGAAAEAQVIGGPAESLGTGETVQGALPSDGAEAERPGAPADDTLVSSEAHGPSTQAALDVAAAPPPGQPTPCPVEEAAGATPAAGSRAMPTQATPIVASTGKDFPPKSGARATTTPGPALASPAVTASASVVGKQQCIADDTPLQDINQQLLTATKTVSTRKKRPKTPHDFTFAVPPIISFPSTHKEADGGSCQVAMTPSLAGARGKGSSTPKTRGAGTPFASASPGRSVDDDVGNLSEILKAVAPAIGAGPPPHQADVVPETPQSPAGPTPRAGCRTSQVEPQQLDGGEILALGKETPSAEETPAAAALPGGNIVKGLASFIPMVKGAQAAPPQPAAGKAAVKVKALEVGCLSAAPQQC
mmetsp:Transcript_39094/g.110720  ORF Transcript_39094/g.110720 Transcript_39094/m.110720 type:complete len:541 (-) Transcript_39094:1778-3400(-)